MERVRVNPFAVFSEMWKSRPNASDEYSDEADKEQEEELIALAPNISMELIKALRWCKTFSINFFKEKLIKITDSFRGKNRVKGQKSMDIQEAEKVIDEETEKSR